MAVVTILLKVLFWIVVVMLPLLGAWVGSSLAAFQNGPTWVPIVCAAVAFPIAPLAWEAFGEWRRRRRMAKKSKEWTDEQTRADQQKRFLQLSDRIILRTAAINSVLLIALLSWSAKDVFTALSTRGDWFLDGSAAKWAPKARAVLFSAADKLEWLWDLTHDNPFADVPKPGSSSSSSSGGPTPTPSPPPDPTPPPDPKPTGTAKRTPDGGDGGKPEAATAKRWPFPAELHPVVKAIPSSEEGSIESVGKYIGREVKDPFMLVKALHDYVADRIAYDAVGLAEKTYYRKQGAETVFRTKIGVCAGYARLLAALGKVAGTRIVYVGGYSRDMNGEIGGQGHAWNAAEIEGQWYLIDATWDAGYVSGRTFTKKYTADYLLTPPKVFGINHFPDKEKWQLRKTPISRGDFMRLPNLRPRFYANFELLSPDRSQVTVDEDFLLSFRRRRAGQDLYATFGAKEGSGRHRCKMVEDKTATCDLTADGTYRVTLWVGPKGKSHWYAGQFEVHRR